MLQSEEPDAVEPSTSSTSGTSGRRRIFCNREQYRLKKIEVLNKARQEKAAYYAAKLKIMEKSLEERKERFERKKEFLKNLFEV